MRNLYEKLQEYFLCDIPIFNIKKIDRFYAYYLINSGYFIESLKRQ